MSGPGPLHLRVRFGSRAKPPAASLSRKSKRMEDGPPPEPKGEDPRIVWLREKVCLGLEIGTQVFYDLLFRDDKAIELQLQEYFNGNKTEQALLFWTFAGSLHCGFGHFPDDTHLSMFFLKNVNEIPIPTEDVEAAMHESFEFGVLPGHTLLNLEHTLQVWHMTLVVLDLTVNRRSSQLQNQMNG